MFVESAPSQPPEPLEVYPGTTGIGVVSALDEYIWQIKNAGNISKNPTPVDGAPSLVEGFEEAGSTQELQPADEQLIVVAKEIREVRSKIAQLRGRPTRILAEYCENSVPDEIKAIKEEGKFPETWQSWLVKASNDHLAEFLRWHVSKIHEQQVSPRVETWINQKKEVFKRGVEKGLKRQWLNPDAEYAIDGVDWVDVYVGDVFDTLMQDRGGYHRVGTSEVVVAAPIDMRTDPSEGIRQSIEHALIHEWGHALIGRFMQPWWNEAADDHVAVSIEVGQHRVLDPEKRVRQSQRYRAVRTLASVLIGDLETEKFTRAFSETKADNTDRKALEEGIIEYWTRQLGQDGSGILDAVHRRINVLQSRLQQSGRTSLNAMAIAAEKTTRDLRTNPRILLES